MILILGFMAHSAFPAFGNPSALAPLFPVNESVWEHLKLGLWPVLLMGLIEYWKFGSVPNNLMHSIACRVLVINGTVLAIFYSYTTILGHSIVLVDILSYVVGASIGQWIALKLWTRRNWPHERISLLGILAMIGVFAWFSYAPPELPIFQDGRTGGYGF